VIHPESIIYLKYPTQLLLGLSTGDIRSLKVVSECSQIDVQLTPLLVKYLFISYNSTYAQLVII